MARWAAEEQSRSLYVAQDEQTRGSKLMKSMLNRTKEISVNDAWGVQDAETAGDVQMLSDAAASDTCFSCGRCYVVVTW